MMQTIQFLLLLIKNEQNDPQHGLRNKREKKCTDEMKYGNSCIPAKVADISCEKHILKDEQRKKGEGW